jgi:malate dehydrogenase (oxaloacetate-decarboxylating)(NADP+)
VITKEEALRYHADGRPGKIKLVPTKPTVTQKDLSLAYSPGVAEPCREIAKHPGDAYRYTAKGNLVAVISNGTAVLGLGNIGALAGKPVMEGKGVLFKRFADIDVFDIEIDSTDPQEIIRTCELIAPTFGGINLEDIRAPECFEIEETLKATLDIPVFHDDQHGTAIISAAALLNALVIQDKKIEDVRVVFSGAGASGTACARLYRDLGAAPESITLVDSRGVLYEGRSEGMTERKAEFAVATEARTLEDAMRGADVFVGLSQAGLVTPDMVKSMAADPIIFAMANPDPEISPPAVAAVRTDAIIATGRSDYPNQVNNVLGFPFIFRGALDVRATSINEAMKRAAVNALAELAQRGEAIPEVVKRAYPGESMDFGPTYIIPKPFDPRVLLYVAPAVAQAAIDTGVAREPLDIVAYDRELRERIVEVSSL